VNGVAAAAVACDFSIASARADEKDGSARFVLVADWQAPRPESALVEVRLTPGGEGTSVRIDSHSLAEYGMRAPDAEGSGSGCLPCAQAQAKAGLVQYSRGLAMGNMIRAASCLADALSGTPRER